MIVLGLTGSIGMGKSTTAQMFKDAGGSVFDADLCVHQLYEGAAVPLVGEKFPQAIIDNRVDRKILSKIIMEDQSALKKLEAIVHPLVEQERKGFIQQAKDRGENFVIIDQPLLFEMGGDHHVDGVIVVTAPENVQRDRVLARDNMSEEKFQYILSKQIPDFEKRKRADFIIDTSKGLEAAKMEVLAIIEQINLGKFLPKG